MDLRITQIFFERPGHGLERIERLHGFLLLWVIDLEQPGHGLERIEGLHGFLLLFFPFRGLAWNLRFLFFLFVGSCSFVHGLRDVQGKLRSAGA